MGSHGSPANRLRRYWPWLAAAVVLLVGLGVVVVPRLADPDPGTGPLIILSGRDQSGGQRTALVTAWNLRPENKNRQARIVVHVTHGPDPTQR